MTDRKAKERDENKLALEIMTRAWEKKQLRDELFIQLCRQTTANHKSWVDHVIIISVVLGAISNFIWYFAHSLHWEHFMALSPFVYVVT